MILEGLRNAMINTMVELLWLALIIHVVSLLAILLVMLRHKLATMFIVLCAVPYLVIAIGQSIGISERYGMMIIWVIRSSSLSRYVVDLRVHC
ncbi:MAG: hypothetical protein DRJ40_04985 [Thermoprotei archaeon]|nr:MAG: hypothetical protein DRJ40_04540 [Thermoprotei archaeon]RLE56754.1 MAG: hypothetical protein DRJ40_04985 [Thermoprotei archaeon]